MKRERIFSGASNLTLAAARSSPVIPESAHRVRLDGNTLDIYREMIVE